MQEWRPQPIVEINLNDGQIISSPSLEIKGTADADQGFKKWVLEYGQGEEPGSWIVLSESNNPVKDGILHTWNLTNIPNGIVTLRLTLIGAKAEVDKRIRLNLSLPTPTAPPPTLTNVPTSTPTITPVPPTSIPTETPTQVVIIPTETPTPVPTETPTTTP